MRTFYNLRRFFRINAVGGLVLIIVGGLLHAHDALLLVVFGVGVFAFGVGGEVGMDECQRRWTKSLEGAYSLIVGDRIFYGYDMNAPKSEWTYESAVERAAANPQFNNADYDEETAAAHADHDAIYRF